MTAPAGPVAAGETRHAVSRWLPRPFAPTLLLLAMAAVLLGACSSNAAELPPDVTQPVTIRIAAFAGPETRALFRIIPEWEHLTGNHVELGIVRQGSARAVTNDYVEYRQAIVDNARAHSGDYDVIIIDDPWMPFLAGNGYLTALAPFGYESGPDVIGRSAVLGVWPPPFGPQPPDARNVARGAETYAIPLVGNVMLLWYREDVISRPDSLDDLIDELAHPDPAFTMAAGLAPTSNPHGFLSWLYARGGEFFDRDWRASPLRTQVATDALAEYLHEVTRLGVPFDVYQSERYSPETRILDGTATAAVAWAADAQKLLTSAVSDQIRVTQFPFGRRQTALTGNWLLGLPSDSRHQAVAYDFITWATSHDVMKTSALLGVPPVRRSLFEDRELISTFPWLPALADSLSQAFARPRVPAWDYLEGVLSCSLDEALRSAEQVPSGSIAGDYAEIARRALSETADRVEATMAEWGYYQPSEYWSADPARHPPGDPTQEYTCPGGGS
ncbi:MAG: extracellular solute-binding protein [Dehalococcoidia bacterium]